MEKSLPTPEVGMDGTEKGREQLQVPKRKVSFNGVPQERGNSGRLQSSSTDRNEDLNELTGYITRGSSARFGLGTELRDDDRCFLNLEEDDEPAGVKRRDRERKRRKTINVRFNELAVLVMRNGNGKSDKESVLADAIEHVRQQSSIILELTNKNQALSEELETQRAEKIELRADKRYLHDELASIRSEHRRLQKDHLVLWETARESLGDHANGLSACPAGIGEVFSVVPDLQPATKTTPSESQFRVSHKDREYTPSSRLRAASGASHPNADNKISRLT